MKQLNKTELQIMKHLWKLKKAFMKDIVNEYAEPKPAYTTISTLINRMVSKGYVGFEKLGRDKHYFPQLQKQEYFSGQIRGIISHFFNNSSAQFASFFTRKTDLNIDQLKELQALIEKQIKEKEND